MKNGKKEPWRLVAGGISVAFILWMWVKKDAGSLYASLPKEEALPLLVTTAAVSLAKIAAIAGAILLVKWLAGKRKG